MPFGALLRSETTIKHFTWCSRAEHFVECTKRQSYQPTSVAWSVLSKRFRPVATAEDELEIKASVIYLLSIQFKYISRRGLKTLQAMLILHSFTEPGSNWQETRMPDKKSDTCEVTLWSNSIPILCCYSLVYKASYRTFVWHWALQILS